MNHGLCENKGSLAPSHASRRRWPRFKRRLELEYRVDSQCWQRDWRHGFTTNAGARGFCVASAFIPPPRARVQVRVRLPGSPVMEMWARVVWAEQPTSAGSRAPSSFGLELTAAPEAWFQYCYLLMT